jgi:hypothetical protein
MPKEEMGQAETGFGRADGRHVSGICGLPHEFWMFFHANLHITVNFP